MDKACIQFKRPKRNLRFGVGRKRDAPKCQVTGRTKSQCQRKKLALHWNETKCVSQHMHQMKVINIPRLGQWWLDVMLGRMSCVAEGDVPQQCASGVWQQRAGWCPCQGRGNLCCVEQFSCQTIQSVCQWSLWSYLGFFILLEKSSHADWDAALHWKAQASPQVLLGCGQMDSLFS